MDFEFTNTIFLLNYLYLLSYLIKNVKSYRYYLVFIVVATTLSVIPLVFPHKYNFYLTILNGFVFVILGVVPGILAKMIYRGMQNHRKPSNKIYFYSSLRYMITWAPIHKYERNVFKSLRLLSQNKLEECITYTQEQLSQAPQQFHSFFHTFLLLCFSYKGLNKKAISVFEDELQGAVHISLRHMVEVYAEENRLDKAAQFLIVLESSPETLKEELYEARSLFCAYTGNIKELEKCKEFLPLWKWQYAEGIFYRFQNQPQKAKECWDNSLSHCDTRAIPKINLQIQYLTEQKNIDSPNEDLLKKLENLMLQPKTYMKMNKKEPFEIVHTVPVVTWMIIATNSIIFLLSEILGGSTDILTLTRLGSNDFLIVEHQQEYWRFISSLFLHYGYLHIALNMLGLHLFGKLVEGLYGWKKFTLIYFATGIFAAVISFATHEVISMSVGASGAVCGLLGVNTYYFLFCGKMHPAIRKHYIFSFLFMISAMIGMSFFFDFIDNAAHFAGIVAGFVLAFLLDKKKSIQFGHYLQNALLVIVGMALFTTYFNIYNKYSTYPYHLKTVPKKIQGMQLDLPFSWKSYAQKNKKSSQEYQYFDRYSIDSELKYAQAFIHFVVCDEAQKNILVAKKLLRLQYYKNIKVSEITKQNINNNMWQLYEISYSENIRKKQVNLREDWYFYSNGKKAYFVTFIFANNSYQKYQSMKMNILESIKF
ncbi:rhomboid family intramembrane serine protease [Candidatus Uabimicrobium sp. HlEnr_7]|uniref:rhomboid family intramembrane serine protease n=1 Tax=Candidatus Uabimicrobium helgolandensis TaxID=3095367 RepID=UPI0035582E1B